MTTVSNMMNESINNFILKVYNIILIFISNHILEIVLFVLILSFVIYLQASGRMKLSSGQNSAIGSLFYMLFCIFIFIIFYWIFGPGIISNLWFLIISSLSYSLVKRFLKMIGFWTY